MRTRRASPARRTSAPGSSRRRLASAATLVPLAIGLGTNLTTGRARPSEPTACDPANSALSVPCTLSFQSICQMHEIDDSCGPEGSATTDPQIAQNTAKNNFCASGTPANLSFKHFDTLQANATAAHVTFGNDSRIPRDRSPLAHLLSLPGSGTIGEGSLVRFAAFVVDAHYSNVSRGESVNCKNRGRELNDIHIVLAEGAPTAGATFDECSTVTAEISPHFRPEVWTPENLNSVARTKQFRFTGQLFFDASHRPCEGTTVSNPARRSIFEIHPVYAVEVCKSASSCKVDDDAAWMALHEWLDAGES